MSDEETNLEGHESAETEDQPGLADVIFLKMGLPEILASRTMRAYVIDEILTALLRAGILTREQLSTALARGKKDVLETCQRLNEPNAKGKVSTEAAEAAEKMAKTAAGISERLHEEFINDKPPVESE